MNSGRVTRLLHRPDALYGSGAGALLVGLLGAAVLNLAFHAVVVASVDSDALGKLGILLVLLLGSAVVFDALTMVVVRSVAGRASRAPPVLLEWWGPARWFAAVGAVLGSLFAIAMFPRVDDPSSLSALTPVLIVGYMIVVGTGAVPRGVLLGRGDYRPVARSFVLGRATRLLTFVVASELGAAFGSVVAALVVGEIVTTTVAARAATRESRLPGNSIPIRPLELKVGELLAAAFALAGMWAFLAVQFFAAYRFLPDHLQVPYIAGVDVVRVVLFVPEVLTLVALACFARGGRKALDALRVTLRASAVFGLLAAALVATIGPAQFASFVPSGVGMPVSMLAVLAITACALGLMFVLVCYHLMRGLPCAGTVWTATTVAFVGVVLWHSRPAALATVAVLAALVPLARLLAGPALVGTTARGMPPERRLLHSSPAELDLTVVVPFFNPGADVLDDSLHALVRTLERESIRFEVIAVSDGSTDGSEELARRLESRGVQTVVLEANRGKGAALRAGLSQARGRFLGFIDADGDIPPELWHHFLTLATLYEADMIVGSKRHQLSEVHYPPLRRLYSQVFQRLVHALFRVDTTDTQTGIKMFRREVLADVLPVVVEDGFVFDLELLVVARQRGWRRVFEAPVRIDHHFRSTISLRSVLRMLRDTCALAVRLHVTRSYDRPAPPLDAPLPVSLATSSR